jgi:hypothetical protein
MIYVLHFKNGTVSKEGRTFFFSTFHQIVQLLQSSMGSNDLLIYFMNEAAHEKRTKTLTTFLSR